MTQAKTHPVSFAPERAWHATKRTKPEARQDLKPVYGDRSRICQQSCLASHKVFNPMSKPVLTGPRTTSIAPRGNCCEADRTFRYATSSRYLPLFLKMTGREKSRPSSAIKGGGGGTGLARSTIARAA